MLGVVGALLLAGCSTYVTVQSNPEGAEISSLDGQTVYGRAPVQLTVDRDTLKKQNNTLDGFKATWVSGATAQTAPRIAVTNPKEDLTIRLDRPADAPGATKDYQFALELVRQQLEQTQLRLDRERLYRDSDFFFGPPPPPIFWVPPPR